MTKPYIFTSKYSYSHALDVKTRCMNDKNIYAMVSPLCSFPQEIPFVQAVNLRLFFKKRRLLRVGKFL